MLREFRDFIDKNSLFTLKDRILATISGGADSVVLLDLLHRANYTFEIAHCNFHLRGEESDRDEVFVKSLASKYGVKIHTIDFDTEKYASDNSISIEMAARDLRYEWFNNLVESNNFTYIATGHHKDDIVETVILNLTRGTGVRGLTGIKAKRDNIVRPLLFADRGDILEYIDQQELTFMEDSSNSSLDYQRNLVRHKIAPLLEQLNPSYRNSIYNTTQNLAQTERLYLSKVEEIRDRGVKESNFNGINGVEKVITIDIGIDTTSALYELMRPYKFNRTTVNHLIANIESGESGKLFYSKSHSALRDRDTIIIKELDISKDSRDEADSSRSIEKSSDIQTEELSVVQDSIEVNIDKIISEEISTDNSGNSSIYSSSNSSEVARVEKFTGLKLQFQVVNIDPSFKVIPKRTIAYLDLNSIDNKILFRHWKRGDSFTPFGMRGKKKLSDYFIDSKFTIHEKESQWIMTSSDRIAWIVGERIDNNFRVSSKTERAIIITQL